MRQIKLVRILGTNDTMLVLRIGRSSYRYRMSDEDVQKLSNRLQSFAKGGGDIAETVLEDASQ